VAAALLLGWILVRVHGAGARGIVAACVLLYLGNPLLLSEAQNGQETALACLAAVCLLGSTMLAERWFLVACVFATFARTDLLLLAPFLSLARHGFAVRSALAPLLAGISFAVANFAIAGSVVPDSAEPIPWLFAQHYAATGPGWGDDLRRLWWWLRPCLLGGPWAQVSPVLAGVLVFVAFGRRLAGLRFAPLLATALAWVLGAEDLGVALVASFLFAMIAGRERSTPRLPLAALVAGWFAIALLHHVIRHYPRPYYFAPLGVAGIAALAELWRRRPATATLAAVAVAGLQVAAALHAPEQRAWQREMRMAGMYLGDLLPRGEPVGCFNSGLVSYLYDGPVLNLDGVVNRPAFDAMRANALGRYLDDHDVCFVLDEPVQFALRDPWPHASGRHFGGGFDPSRDLEEIARFDVPDVDEGVPGTDAVRLYWRVGRGPRPDLPMRPRLLGRAADGHVQVLWRGGADTRLYLQGQGTEPRPIARGAPGVAFVVDVPPAAPGRYILHEGDLARPVLTLIRN